MCLFMLLGSPASGESATDDRLAPQDTVEIGVSGWHTLLGGVAEATLLNDTFTIGRGGTLELPGIGRLPAAGLSESELAKLIADRLQVRSGSHQRPVTTVQRRTRAPDVPPLRATARVTGAPAAARPRVTEPTAQPQTLGSERSRGEELQEARREALAARQAARDATIRHYRRLVEERRRAVTLAQELHAARAHIEAMKVQLQQQAKAARDGESAVTEANEARELAALERTKRAALEEKLLAARKEIDATKNGALLAGRQRDATLRDDLAATRSDLEAMRRAADEAGAQARKVAAMAADQERALENERRRAEGLARDRAMMLREIERLQMKTAGAIRSKAAALRARDAAEASLINARRVLDDERRKLAAQERELVLLRQSALQVRAELQAAKQAAEVAARERAERAALEEKLLAAREEVDAIKNGALPAGRQREASLRHDLAEARSDLEAMRRAADEAGSQARKLAVLTAGEVRSKAAALRERNAAGALLSDARRALEDERRKLAAQERDLALLRQSALQTRAELQAAKQAALQAGRLAEATASRAGEALDLERERGRSLARDLESAREERDVARKQLALSVAALGKALGDEPDRSNSRELAVEGKEVKLPKREAQRPMASIEHRRKAGVGDRASARGTPVARKRGGSVEVRKVELGKPTRSVQSVTLALPEELLPTRSPVRGR
ncbi:polysaccharide biosynthesis/export family protein [Sinorhizobium americanum]|uniref:polysaccharide biosynthesis/export family protein n=1 Tax=Sinorhizobium americanum TaxID=194963 RepID=UPI001FDA6028|nr:polysaccharide biosynthesis/export family protein [Sinorhizobium americanum]